MMRPITAPSAMARLRPATALQAVMRRGQPLGRRSFASETSSPKSTNPTSAFYKQFTRPVAKTLLLAVFTYQLAYWTWAKLETDEVRAERDETIAKLEATVKEYDEKTKTTAAKTP